MKFAARKWPLLLASFALLVGIAICISVVSKGPPQIITLSDGHQYQFAGATWGTNHTSPGFMSHLAALLPGEWADELRNRSGNGRDWIHFTQPLPSLVIWMKPAGPKAKTPFSGSAYASAPNSQLAINLVNADGAKAGPLVYQAVPQGNLPTLFWIQFTAFPRREKWVNLHVAEYSFPPGQLDTGHALGDIKFRNPLYRSYPQWQPEPVPAMKMAGDVEVKLTRFALEAASAAAGRPPVTSFEIEINSPRQDRESWLLDETELSDATGNKFSVRLPTRYPDGHYTIENSLWPEEQAYKLRLGIRRTRGYDISEIITLTNIPVNSTPTAAGPGNNGVSITNTVHGTRVVLRNFRKPGPIFLFSTAPGPYWLEYEVLDTPDETAVDFEQVMTDNGQVLRSPGASGYFQKNINFQTLPANAKSLTVTLVVQKKRYVEFLVKPK